MKTSASVHAERESTLMPARLSLMETGGESRRRAEMLRASAGGKRTANGVRNLQAAPGQGRSAPAQESAARSHPQSRDEPRQWCRQHNDSRPARLTNRSRRGYFCQTGRPCWSLNSTLRPSFVMARATSMSTPSISTLDPVTSIRSPSFRFKSC